jgi:hypothetical protein
LGKTPRFRRLRLSVLAPSRSGWLVRARTVLWPTKLAAIVCLAVCVVAPASIIAVHIDRNPSFSIIDEVEHFDYVQRIAAGNIPRMGEQILPSTYQLLKCIGQPQKEYVLPPCHGWTRARLQKFYESEANSSYEAQQPPLYYAITAVLRWPFIHVLGLSTLNGTRATGLLWTSAGLLLLWIAATILGIEWPLTAAGALFLAAAPTVVLASSIVSNDGAAVFAGGLVAAMGAMQWRYPGRLPWWSFALAGVTVAMLKASFALPAATVAALLAIEPYIRRSDRGDRSVRHLTSAWLSGSGAMLLGAVIATIGWSLAFHALSLVDLKTFAVIKLGGNGQFGFSGLVNNALATLSPFTNTPAPLYQYTRAGTVPATAWSSAISSIQGDVVEFLAVSAGIAWVFVRERGWAHWLGAASLLTLYFGALALGVSIAETYGFDTALPGRYGLPTAVLLVLALIGAIQGRAARLAFSAVSLLCFGLTFWYMLV